MFTVTQIWTFIIAAFGLALTILNLIDKAITMKKNADAPQKMVIKRLDALEVEVKEIKGSLLQGNDRFRDQADTNEVMQMVMLALLDFELSFCSHTNYEHTEDLEQAKDMLRKHLARKGHERD